MIRLIVAIDEKRGIAKHGIQPWFIPEDNTYFGDQTKTNGSRVLMGRKLFDLLGHPLPDRTNYVVSHEAIDAPNATSITDLPAFLSENGEADLWVIGGASIYEQTINNADELYITSIEADFGCDQFFPEYQDVFELTSNSDLQTENGFIFTYCVYTKKTAE